MSFADFFTFKTPRQREKEQRQYNAWAFPYGEAQKQIVSDLLQKLLPDEGKTAMAIYLIGREAYIGGVDEDLADYTVQQRLEYTVRLLRDQLPGRHKRKLWSYLALILADEHIDAQLQYPTVEQLREKAAELEAQG